MLYRLESPRKNTMPDRSKNRFSRRWKSIIVIATTILLTVAGLLYWSLPVATGYAAHYLCTQTLIADREPDGVFRREVAPINPLLRLVRFHVDKVQATVRATGLGFIRPATALYRPGLGCTLIVATNAESLNRQSAQLALPPPPTMHVEHSPDSGTAEQGERQSEQLQTVLDRAMQEPTATSLRNTQAVVVMQHGKLLAERYARGIHPDTPLLGWSMTKTVTALLTGILVQDGKLSLDQDALLPDWSSPRDPRHAIRLQHLLQWTSGLDFKEGHGPGSDTVNMLYRSGDMVRYAARRPLQATPGVRINYESGGSVLLAAILANAISSHPLDIVRFAHQRLFGPLGIQTAIMEPDAAGNLVGGSYMLASARDWSRIGQLILQQGNWQGSQIVSRDWIRFMSTPQGDWQDGTHGAHLWLNAPVNGNKRFMSLPDDTVMLDGFNHQLVVIIPSRQLVVTRLGETVDHSWDTEHFVSDILDSLPI